MEQRRTGTMIIAASFRGCGFCSRRRGWFIIQPRSLHVAQPRRFPGPEFWTAIFTFERVSAHGSFMSERNKSGGTGAMMRRIR
jgi:hypothetical protein